MARLEASRTAKLAAAGRLDAERALATDAERNARAAAEARLGGGAQRDELAAEQPTRCRACARDRRGERTPCRRQPRERRRMPRAVAAEAKAQSDAAGAAAKSEQDKAALREQLRAQLNVILDTRATARGLIVNLSDVLFDTGRVRISSRARGRSWRASRASSRCTRDCVSRSRGTPTTSAPLTPTSDSQSRRGESVRAYLVQQGVVSTTVGTIGLGETKPVATNGTAAGRQQNRRVELIVSGESIGTL